MPSTCCVPYCRSNYKTETKSYSIFEFPKNEDLCEKWLHAIKTYSNVQHNIKVITASTEAVLSRSATLPCEIEPHLREDRVYMVLWYKEGYSKPIYSFDVRGRRFNDALHWSDPKVFGPRAFFVTVSKPAALTIEGVQLDDESIYRCRVDFRTSPTRNVAVNLTVIVPPNKLLLYENSGRELTTSVVGPLEEGANLVLTCEVRGGRPIPTLSWFVNERKVEGRIEAVGNHVVVNRLEVKDVDREMLNSTYKCQAANTKLTMPIEKMVRLELLLRPISSIILLKPEVLIANEEVTIQCEIQGSRPKAMVIWQGDGRRFRRGKIVEDATNETVVFSSVTFVPVPEDDGTVLKCIGENPKLPDASQEDSFRLNVIYPPQVSLHLGNTLNPDDIKEGDDVYFECNIKANPKQHKITWYHDDILIVQNVSIGIIISTKSLVLQRINKSQSGKYSCIASNPRGDTKSDPVHLRVRYAPVCLKDSEVTIIGASLEENLKIRCQVSADPSDISFVWQFNNSGESFDVSPTRFSTRSGNVSELAYRITSQRNYGTLACWGENDVGKQAEPCLFQVVSATKPAPLTNCTLRSLNNQSSETVEVECKAGYDGGLPQKFVLEAFDVINLKLRVNVTVEDIENPTFHLDLGDLYPPPSSLRIFVYAVNGKGKSDRMVLDDIILNDAAKRTDSESGIGLLPLAGLLTGSLLTLGIAVLVIVVVAVRRKRSCNNSNHCPHHITLDGSKHNPKSQGSMLEINTGDNRYVVAYTVKPTNEYSHSNFAPDNLATTPESHSQPDILNTPRGVAADDTQRFSFEHTSTVIADNDLAREILEPHHRNLGNCISTTSHLLSPSNYDVSNTLGRPKLRSNEVSSYHSFATIRRDHIIADTIPGPESCV